MALFVGALGFAACSDDDNTSTDPGEGGENTKPEVSVVVTPGATTASSVSFTVAPQNADKCAYVCLKNVEGIELPDAVSVMAEGRQLEKVETQLVELTGGII